MEFKIDPIVQIEARPVRLTEVAVAKSSGGISSSLQPLWYREVSFGS
jgi:hypothetical protein